MSALEIISQHKAEIIRKCGELPDEDNYSPEANLIRSGNRKVGAMNAIKQVEELLR